MRLIRRLPVYASGAGFTAGLIAVAEARNWSGMHVALVALGVGAFYVVTILVPWLIREQVGPQIRAIIPALHADGDGFARVSVVFASEANGDVLVVAPDPSSSHIPVTHGDIAVHGVELHAVASG